MPQLFGRKASVFVTRPAKGNPFDPANYLPEITIDLSQMQFQFHTAQQDEESPDNCVVRLFNLKDETRDNIIKFGFSEVTVQAGYDGQYGVIFQGTIKQFRVGKTSNVDKYLDILSADGDLAYNFGIAQSTVRRQSPKAAVLSAIVKDYSQYGVTVGKDLAPTGGTLIRGKTMYGLARVYARQYAESAGCTWNLNGNKINVTPLDGYLPGEAVVISTATGLVGVPEQTQDGIKCTVLCNPRIQLGGRVKLDNKLVNQLIGAQGNTFAGSGSISFNSYSQVQFLASVAADGLYRVYVVEHEGDTRGTEFYTNLTLLAINPTTDKVAADVGGANATP